MLESISLDFHNVQSILYILETLIANSACKLKIMRLDNFHDKLPMIPVRDPNLFSSYFRYTGQVNHKIYKGYLSYIKMLSRPMATSCFRSFRGNYARNKTWNVSRSQSSYFIQCNSDTKTSWTLKSKINLKLRELYFETTLTTWVWLLPIAVEQGNA